MISKVFDVIAKERPVGTAANDKILDFLEKQFEDMNYSIRTLPFDSNQCLGCWSCFNHCPQGAIYTEKIKSSNRYNIPQWFL